MRTSRSPSRAANPPPPSHSIWPWILIAVVAVVAVAVAVMPASAIGRFLPEAVRAEDFSGSLWHGSAGRIWIGQRDAGALEWRLHPAALLHLSVDAEFHWVKVGFVIDGTASLDRKRFTARDLKGAGPLQDLRDFGIDANWRGSAEIAFREITGTFTQLTSAVGRIAVANFSTPQLAEGADWGGYALELRAGAVTADGGVNAILSDTGGPLEFQGRAHVSPVQRLGTLAGTVKERTGAPLPLRRQLADLAQMRGRDSEGRIPLDLEFTF